MLDTLIIDDDFRVAAVHQGFVEKVPGYRVVGKAHTAAEALDLCRALRPDVVLLDIYLPDGDGLSVARSMLDSPQPPTVIVISAASDLDAVRGAIRLGAAHYLVKPFAFATLVERLIAVRDTYSSFQNWPELATQGDIDQLFDALRPQTTEDSPQPRGNLAPTLELVLKTLVTRGSGLSAVEVAREVGISRATAQRCLAQLERANVVKLELRYGQTGRPEHRYSAKR